MSRASLPIRATTADLRTYRRLLKSDWSRHAFEEALGLIRRLAAMPPGLFDREVPPTQGRLRAARASAAALRYPIPPTASSDLREHLEALNSVLPPPPDDPQPHVKSAQVRLWAEVRELAVLLSAEHWARPAGDEDLFLDARSLALQLALEHLIPRLDAAGMADERDYLLSAAWGHAVVAWQNDPSHQSFLMASILTATGASSEAGKRYLHAFKLCPRDSHEYLTLAHAYWFHLLDAGQTSEAESFLFSLHRVVREEDAAEVEEMIRVHLEKSRAA